MIATVELFEALRNKFGEPEAKSIIQEIKKVEKREEKTTISDELVNEIEHSKSILKLKNNWDEEGAKGYKKETYHQAITFLSNYAKWANKEYGIVIAAPKILPADNGSISLYWKRVKYDLLITIPEYPNTIATFYGDDKGKTKIEGEFPIENHERGVFLCLLEKK